MWESQLSNSNGTNLVGIVEKLNYVTLNTAIPTHLCLKGHAFGMLQVREMRFHCANGLVVLRICAPLEEHWLQKMRFAGSNAFFSVILHNK